MKKVLTIAGLALTAATVIGAPVMAASTSANGMTVDVNIKNTSTGAFQSEVEAKGTSGSISVKADIKNTDAGTTQMVAFVTLPQALSFASGTTKVTNKNNPSGKLASTDNITAPQGLNIGTYAQNETATVEFNANIDSSKLVCGRNSVPVSVAVRKADYPKGSSTLEWTTGFTTANATVNITKDCGGELPETGAGAVAAVAAGVGALATGAGYLIVSRKK
jgi:LPXTG-motif cell wall-anchored protein